MSDFVLESDLLRVQVDPQAGGKIRSLVSKRSGQEYFYQDLRPSLDNQRGYSQHDMSGYDECFPTVGAGSLRFNADNEIHFPDHGYVWQRPCEACVQDGSIELRQFISEIKCSFRRTNSLESPSCLMLSYCIENRGSDPLPYVYSAHPLLNIDPTSRIRLPDEVDKIFVSCILGDEHAEWERWIDWPIAPPDVFAPPYQSDRHNVAKLITHPLNARFGIVEYPNLGESLRISFGGESMRHLGVLLYQGYDEGSDGQFRDKTFVALEPMTALGDNPAGAQRTGTLQQLTPGKTVEFWVRIELHPFFN